MCLAPRSRVLRILAKPGRAKPALDRSARHIVTPCNSWAMANSASEIVRARINGPVRLSDARKRPLPSIFGLGWGRSYVIGNKSPPGGSVQQKGSRLWEPLGSDPQLALLGRAFSATSDPTRTYVRGRSSRPVPPYGCSAWSRSGRCRTSGGCTTRTRWRSLGGGTLACRWGRCTRCVSRRAGDKCRTSRWGP